MNRTTARSVPTTRMNSPKGPLVQQLMLLVLALILACLVLLVMRAYQQPPPESQRASSSLASEVAPVVEEQAPSEPAAPASTPVPLKGRVIKSVARGSLPSPSPRPAHLPSDPAIAGGSPQAAPTEAPAATVLAEVVQAAPGRAGIAASAGVPSSLSGAVILIGTPKPEIPIDLGPSCSRLNPGRVTTRHFVVSPEGGLANVLVYVQNARPGGPLVEAPLLDQVGCMFEPYVLALVAGQELPIRNSDPEFHNIHGSPKINREFNLGQPLPGTVMKRSLDQPELFIRLKCDVHPWMFAYVCVLNHPFFAVTDTNGLFRLPGGLPAGEYQVTARHLKAGELTQTVTLGEGERRELRFDLSIDPAVQSQSSVARVP